MGFATLEDLTGAIEILVFPKVLERVSLDLMPDTAVIATGRLSIREDEDPKLLLDSLEPLPTDAEAAAMAKKGVNVSFDSAPAPQDAVLPGSTLYLRLPSDSAIQMVQPVLRQSPGNVSVVLYIESTGNKLRAPKELCITPTRSLIDALVSMLGAKNVVLK
jgi:DNA polymerase-3 subunit alpha